MIPRINVVTLAVSDLEHAVEFYRDGLGFPSRGILGAEFKGDEYQAAGAVGFFELQGGLILALYPRTELAKDAKLRAGAPNPLEVSLGVLVESREAVDRYLQKAAASGATISDKPHDRPWGVYSGYFQDPDGHLWEIIWNPEA